MEWIKPPRVHGCVHLHSIHTKILKEVLVPEDRLYALVVYINPLNLTVPGYSADYPLPSCPSLLSLYCARVYFFISID